MAGLREKQKEERQRNILEAARQQFRAANYRDVTIESIADEAGLSAMTVFNYYGSKGGLLLSLVAESDRHLIAKIDDLLATDFPDATTAVNKYSLAIFDHAFSYLDRQTWGHVLATSILEGNSTFGSEYASLDQELIDRLAKLLESLKQRGLVNDDCDTATAAQVIYNVHNARFVEFASNPEHSRESIDALTKKDIDFVVGSLTPNS